MYLSRLRLNPLSNQVKTELNDIYQLHRTILKAFSEELSKDERVLFRVEPLPRHSPPFLLVQSQTKPDWEYCHSLQDNRQRPYLLPDHLRSFDDGPNPAVGTFDFNDLEAGQVCRFRLRANPTKRLNKDIPEKNLKKGQRIGLFAEGEQLAWLQRQAESHGFVVGNLHIVDEGFHGGKTKDEQRLKFFAVRFEGQLQVIDPEAMLKTVKSGIGPAKAFGCGLLSLAPVR